MKTILVLGVGLAGAPVIRQLMRTTVLKRKDLKMVVVAPTTHFHWPIAMPRVVVPGLMADEKAMYQLGPTFSEYPADKFEFVLGSASAMNPSASTVTVALNDGGGDREISYDTLIVATGSSAKDDMPWKITGTAAKTIEKLHSLQKDIEAAETIVVAGGGLTGVETTGELGHKYALSGKKKVIFVYDKELPLSADVIKSVRKQSKAELERMNVKLMPSTRVVKVTKNGGDTSIEVKAADGSTKALVAQAYLPTTGLTPNTAFVPPSMLDSNGRIRQSKSLQAEGYSNIFVLGDAGNLQEARALHADTQAAHLIKVLPAYLEGGSLQDYEISTKPMYGISLGPSKATGQMGNFKVFGFLIWYLKGRFLGTDQAPFIAAGKRTMSVKFEK